MKKVMLTTLACVLAVMMLLCGCSKAAANADEGMDVKKGDKIEYTFNIADSQQNVSGFYMVLFFDQDMLAIDEVSTPFAGSTFNKNENNDGQIIILHSLINEADGYACYEKSEFVTAEFTAIADGHTTISYYIPYIYDLDLVNIERYTFTCDVAVGYTKTEGLVPKLHDVSGIDGFDAGDFENNESGRSDG